MHIVLIAPLWVRSALARATGHPAASISIPLAGRAGLVTDTALQVAAIVAASVTAVAATFHALRGQRAPVGQVPTMGLVAVAAAATVTTRQGP